MSEESNERSEAVERDIAKIKKRDGRLDNKGRPRLGAAMRRSDILHTRVTPGEYEMVKEMAKECEMSISAYVVAACFAFCGKSPSRAHKIAADRRWVQNHIEQEKKK